MPDSIPRLNEALQGRYHIERQLGEGGMATVYLAEDLRHERAVAIKVPHSVVTQPAVAARFHTEIKTTAKLQHPHILPVYDSGEVDDLLYFVMPFIEGESLRERIEREGHLSVMESIHLIREVADALAYAHQRGVVHRDIKPANIMIANGHAMVADFGIARAIEEARGDRLTMVGERVGTAAYMSPEQAAGEIDVDGRSDIYSLGCVLFEMLAGDPPFEGGSAQAVIAQRFRGSPPSVREKCPVVPNRVDAAIRTALALAPEERFQNAARFADALTIHTVGAAGRDEVDRSIAVLPFANMSGDDEAEFFSDGVTEDLLNALVRLPGLRVIARTSAFALKGQSLDVREVGKRLGVGLVLEGSVRRAGERLRISARLVDALRGHQLWSERYDRQMRDVFAVQDEIASAIRDALSERLVGIGRVQDRTAPHIDPDTYELFLRGRFFVGKRAEGMQKGMEQLAEVVARAPRYAPAYAELATAHSLMTMFCAMPPRVGWPKVRELAEAALSLDPQLARAHAELGNAAFWFDWDWASAQAHYERAVSLGPHDPWVDALYGHYLAALGDFDEAIGQCERARSLDPLNPSVSVSLATTLFLARRHEEAIRVCESILEQDATYSDACRIMGAALRELGRFEDAARATEAAVRFSGAHPWTVSLEGMLNAAAGRREAAERIAETLISRYTTPAPPFFVPPLAIALVYGQLDDVDRYFAWMERAFEARDSWMVMLQADPSYARHRDTPHHDALVERVGIPAWERVA